MLHPPQRPCRHCRAPIFLARHPKTGRMHPFDVEPVELGLYVRGLGDAMIDRRQLDDRNLTPTEPRYRSHISVCTKLPPLPPTRAMGARA